MEDKIICSNIHIIDSTVTKESITWGRVKKETVFNKLLSTSIATVLKVNIKVVSSKSLIGWKL